MNEQIVMSDSPEAAQYRTDLKGWVSRDGYYYGDGPQNERTARYAGCTHVPCNRCGAPTPKGYTQCRGCRDLTYIAEYESMPRAEWDGKALLYSEARDQYYSAPDDAAEDLEEDQTLVDLRLVICEPNYVRQLEWDYCCDDLPENADVPDDVAEAMEAFNEAVAGIVLSWSPGKKALALPDDGHKVLHNDQGSLDAAADAYEAEYNEARMLEALKAAAQFVETEQFPIGWSVDRIREVIAKVSGATPNSACTDTPPDAALAGAKENDDV